MLSIYPWFRSLVGWHQDEPAIKEELRLQFVVSQIIQEKIGEINELAWDDLRNWFVRDRWETQPNDKCLLQGWKRMLDRLKGEAERGVEAIEGDTVDKLDGKIRDNTVL